MKRTKLKDRALPDYTRGEEIFNMVSHIVGGAFGIAALATCVVKAFLNHDAYEIVSAFIYGFSMVILYTVSSVYHGLIPKTAKKVMQVIDHCTIYFLIAGTYTPLCIIGLGDRLGYILLAAVWSVAALGVTFKICWVTCPKWVSSVMYVVMGWLCMFVAPFFIRNAGIQAFGWLLAGGILYTAGAVFYALKLSAFNEKHKNFGSHEIFHLFVMGGSICHFIFMYNYVA